MLFDYDLVIPAGTLKVTPATAQAKLSKGTLLEIRVIFPPGCASLVYVTVSDSLHQLMPANADGSLNFDNQFIVSRMKYNLLSPLHPLTLAGWSPDAIYPHTITVQLDLGPLEHDDVWTNFMGDILSLG